MRTAHSLPYKGGGLPDRGPPGQRPHPGQRPPRQRSLRTENPPRQRPLWQPDRKWHHAETRPPHGQNDRRVKTLPCSKLRLQVGFTRCKRDRRINTLWHYLLCLHNRIRSHSFKCIMWSIYAKICSYLCIRYPTNVMHKSAVEIWIGYTSYEIRILLWLFRSEKTQFVKFWKKNYPLVRPSLHRRSEFI